MAGRQGLLPVPDYPPCRSSRRSSGRFCEAAPLAGQSNDHVFSLTDDDGIAAVALPPVRRPVGAAAVRYRQAALLKLVFGASSVGLLLWFVPLTEVVRPLLTASFPWLLAGLALQFVVRAAATFRMRVVAANQGVALTHRQLYTLLLATQFYAMFLPGMLAGGATWAKYVQRGAGKAAAAAIVLINRAVIVGVVVAVGVCAWVIDRPVQPAAAAAVIACIVAATLLVIVLPPLPVPQTERAAGAGPRGRLLQFGARFLLFLGLSRAGKLTVIASGIVESLLGAAVLWCFAVAVGVDVEPVAVLWVRAGITVALLLPITVAGLGVREASLVGFGALLGIAPALAIAWSFAILLGTIVVAGVGAIVEANAASGGVSGYLRSREPAEVDERIRRGKAGPDGS